ncbi:hypothetical protein [Methylobacterium indicum]|uniref:hypothetical protein n=1 Tax=Methylobacterium indicum TaxID=1775910 RepID=UPI000AE48EB7|nr:hypothetical protein [Methylobacterium indicum]
MRMTMSDAAGCRTGSRQSACPAKSMIYVMSEDLDAMQHIGHAHNVGSHLSNE